MSAVSAGREEAVILLLENGADVNAENSSGQTALHYAVQLLHTCLHPLSCAACHATYVGRSHYERAVFDCVNARMAFTGTML